MNSWLRKTLIGFTAASTLYTCGYVGGGFFYDTINSAMYIRNKSEGKYSRNKHADPNFRKEFSGEASGLEQKILLGSGCRKQYSIDIFVSENVKLFFDDRNNPNDNGKWAQYVREAVESLNAYGKAGIGFRVGKVIGVHGDILTDHVLYLAAVGKKRYEPYSIDLAFIPPADMKLEENVAGWASRSENFAVVTISNNGHRNKSLVLHEIGHLLRLKHKGVNEMKRALLDPYCIFYKESFMSSYLTHCSSLSLKEDELEILKKRHFK